MRKGEEAMKRMIVGLLVVGLLAGFAYASEKDTAKALVEETAAYVNSQGKEKALAEISTPKGTFDKGALYVFA